jgi:hypothetical protein
MRPARAVVLAAVLLTGAGCAADEPTGGPPATTTAASAGPCAEVVREGATVTDMLIDQGCIDANGTKRAGKVTSCKSGQRMWEMDGMIGISGEKMLTATARTPDGLTARALNEALCLRF